MHIKHLKKANDQLKRLEALDKEIREIERYALKIKDNPLEITLQLSFEKPKVESGVIDADGNLIEDVIRDRMRSAFVFTFGGDVAREEKPKDTCELQISEVIALQVLGVMIAHKEAERMAIIDQLNKIGFEVNL